MSRHALPIIAATVVLTLGCHHDNPTPQSSSTVIIHEDTGTPVGANQTPAQARANDAAVMRAQSMTLEQYAQAVTNAPDRAAQLAALRQLWQYMKNNNYTYQLNAVKLSDGTTVATPATSTDPIRVTMDIFQANQRLYQFSFQPMNNADLTSMTLGGT